MIICQTKRLIIRHFELTDTEYVLKQLNDEAFIRYIADKRVRTVTDAQNYLENGPIASYKRYGFGLNAITLKESGTVVGMCGLVKRDELDIPDLGYAFLPEYWGRGYAFEASKAVLEDAISTHHMKAILGVTLPDNVASNKLLVKLGFVSNQVIELYGSENNLYRYAPEE